MTMSDTNVTKVTTGVAKDTTREKLLLSIDPGKSTGVALVSYTDTEPARVEQTWQFGGGLDGFLGWYEGVLPDLNGRGPITIISEKFTPRQALTLDAATPLLIEGAMIALGLIDTYYPKSPQWQHPSNLYFAGGDTLPQKKSRAHAWLKSHADRGFYVTGKQLGTKDADDARSALLHSVVWFRKQKHRATIERWFPPNA